MTRFRPHNIPMPRTPEGDRLRELIRKMRPSLPPFDWTALELRIVAEVMKDRE